jgi:hypothetical protein
MSLLSRLRAVFRSRLKDPPGAAAPPSAQEAGVFFTFANTGEVIAAENVLKSRGMEARVMAPPPSLRTGCDMVIVTSLVHSFRAATLLEEHNLRPLRMTPVGAELLEPVSLFLTKDYGQWLMVRAANMKLTIEKQTGRIVNVSGGGCPDVPYLAARLVGKNIGEAHLAREHGQTLCGYALHLAVQEFERLRADPVCGKNNE